MTVRHDTRNCADFKHGKACVVLCKCCSKLDRACVAHVCVGNCIPVLRLKSSGFGSELFGAQFTTIPSHRGNGLCLKQTKLSLLSLMWCKSDNHVVEVHVGSNAIRMPPNACDTTLGHMRARYACHVCACWSPPLYNTVCIYARPCFVQRERQSARSAPHR